jgi:hypothetical protein
MSPLWSSFTLILQISSLIVVVLAGKIVNIEDQHDVSNRKLQAHLNNPKKFRQNNLHANRQEAQPVSPVLLNNAFANDTGLLNNFVYGKANENIIKLTRSFQKLFDEKYPSPMELAKKRNIPFSSYSPMQVSNMHPKRCFSLENVNSKQDFLEEKWKPWLNEITQDIKGLPSDLPILITTSCLGLDSLGNYLGSYFENLMCSYYTGLHYFSVSKIWEPTQNDIAPPFLSSLPAVVEHTQPVSSSLEGKEKLKSICKCPGSCHERPYALWTKGTFLIKPLLHNAISKHLAIALNPPVEKKEDDIVTYFKNHTIISKMDMSNQPENSILPLVPDVAIHYRCGDNFVGHYGFLPFTAFKSILSAYDPKTIQTIYILAESRDRKTKHKRHLAQKCDFIFPNLLEYMKNNFPQAKILIKRGDDIYLDFIRLSQAKITICSVSTFCLWPAIINPHGQAYFPQTKLIVGGQTNIDLGFKWITTPQVVLGKMHEHTSPQQLIDQLMGK